MGDKPKTETTTTQQHATKNPWAPTVAPLTDVVNRTAELGANVANFTPQFSGQTMAGIQGLTDLANAGPTGGFQALDNVVSGSGAGFNTGLGTLSNVAGGGMIGANQYLDPVIQRTIDDTTKAVNGQFTAAGRYGSGAHAAEIAKQVGNTVGQMRLSNYGTERTAQDAAAKTLYGGGLQGAGFSGQLDQSSMMPAQINLQAGNLQDQILNANRTAPMNAVNWQASILNPIAQQGGSSDSTGTQQKQTVQPTNWVTTGIGAGMMGLGAFTGNPALMAGGANSMMGGLSGSGGGSGGGMLNSDMFSGFGGGGGGGISPGMARAISANGWGSMV